MMIIPGDFEMHPYHSVLNLKASLKHACVNFIEAGLIKSRDYGM